MNLLNLIYTPAGGFATGLLISLVAGWVGVRKLMTYLDKEMRPPDSDLNEVWRVIFAESYGGQILGALEQTIYFAALWFEAWALLAGWLAFKLGSKWHSWQHVADLPPAPTTSGADAMDEYVIRRHQWSGLRHRTFVIGTAVNIVLAALGVLIARTLALHG